MNQNRTSKTSVIVRFVLLGIAWLALVAAMIVRAPRFTLYQAFVIVASGIIIFMPMYKKYIGNGKN